MATHKPSADVSNDDLASLSDDALLSRAAELSAAADSLRAKNADGSGRAAAAAQRIREHVASRTLATNEADNYARANAPQRIETEE